MIAKKLLGIKIAAVAALLLAVASWLYSSSLAARRRYRPWDGGAQGVDAAYRRAAKELGPPGRHTPANWKARELDDFNRLARGEPVAVYFWLLKNERPGYEASHRYLTIVSWRCLLGPAARAEYARRCVASARQQWWIEDADPTLLTAFGTMGLLMTAYNVADDASQRRQIAREFYNFRLRARARWFTRFRDQHYGVAPTAIGDYVLLDWDLLQAGRGAAAVVRDPLADAQPGTK